MNVGLKVEIDVDRNKVSASRSEKLLGVVCNDKLTWKNHLYGDNENSGLIGVFKTLRKYLQNDRFAQVVSGIFTSKLLYCINVWTAVWNIPGQQNEAKVSISKADINKLQVLQNKTLRLITNLDIYTSTSDLLRAAKSLSVHQLGAFHTLVQVFKIHKTRKPAYHYQRLFQREMTQENQITMRSYGNLQSRVDFKLSTGRSSFFYHGSQLWTALPINIKSLNSVNQFKTKCKEWVQTNIKIKP